MSVSPAFAMAAKHRRELARTHRTSRCAVLGNHQRDGAEAGLGDNRDRLKQFKASPPTPSSCQAIAITRTNDSVYLTQCLHRTEHICILCI